MGGGGSYLPSVGTFRSLVLENLQNWIHKYEYEENLKATNKKEMRRRWAFCGHRKSIWSGKKRGRHRFAPNIKTMQGMQWLLEVYTSGQLTMIHPDGNDDHENKRIELEKNDCC